MTKFKENDRVLAPLRDGSLEKFTVRKVDLAGFVYIHERLGCWHQSRLEKVE